jgi:hypothetical protein
MQYCGGTLVHRAWQYLPIAIYCNLNKYGFRITMVQGNSESVLDSKCCYGRRHPFDRSAGTLFQSQVTWFRVS